MSKRRHEFKKVNAAEYGVTRDDLKDYKRLKLQIRQLREQIADLEDITAGVSSMEITGVKNSEFKDKIAEILIKKDELRGRLVDEINQCLELSEKIERFLNALCERDRIMLKLMYVKGLSWTKTCESMNLKSTQSIADTLERLNL